MGKKSVKIPPYVAREFVKSFDGQYKYTHINEYIQDMEKFGLRPYKKDIRLSSTGSGLGDPKMNHYPVLDGYFRYIITDYRKWMLTKIKYGV